MCTPYPAIVVTDGGFRPDGTFVRWPALSDALRRAVLRLFVRRG
jgi:hypothetical protein